MRFLKTKIQRAQEVVNNLQQLPLPSPLIKAEQSDLVKTEEEEYQLKIEDGYQLKIEEDEYQLKIEDSVQSSNDKPLSLERYSKRTSLGPNSRNLASTKNIAMNYGRAIASFAGSSLAMPYLIPRLEQEGLTKTDFSNFLRQRKSKIQGICGFRSLLVAEEGDDAKTIICKKLFQWLGEVFIKCFSVNWIIHGKVTHKMVYLKFRFKMLRRIQNPEKFTYIKERNQKKSKNKKMKR